MAGKAHIGFSETWLCCGATIGAVLIVIGLSVLVEWSAHVHAPAVLFILPIIIAASVGGVMPGLAAMAAGELALFYFYARPFDQHPALNATEIIQLASYPVVGILVSLLSGSLMQSRQRISSILASITDCYLLLDEGWRVREVNERAAEHLGRPREEMLGQSLWAMVPELAENEAGAALRRAAAQQTQINADVPACKGNWAELHIYPSPGSLTVYFRDITGRKQIEEAMRHSKEAAENANQFKDQFLAALSHELRTPLTPVLMAADSLASDSALPEAVRREAKMIGRNMQVEARLIDDLLDLTRISRGKLQIKREPIDAHELIRYAVDACCRGDAQAQTLQIGVKLNAPHHHIHADPARVQQIVWNLVRNAIKFTPADGAVVLRTRNAGSTGQDPPRLVIEVSDTGLGIPPERLEHIFNPFEQGGAEITRQFGGLGLGLAISRALAELHSGTITAFSAGEGQGATFTVELPTIPAAEMNHAPRPEAPPAPVRSLRILIVEDHQSTAETLAQLLRSSGHHVEVAGTVADAMRQSEHELDLVISDLGLPDGSGLDLMRRLKARSGLKGIALSGYGMEEDIRKSLEAGFDEHLTKPINIRTVESALARVMG